jgi:short-subunit dehydrogenase
MFKNSGVKNMMAQDGVIVIAGASKGLGRELACKAYEMHYPIALIARDKSGLISLRDKIQADENIPISTHAVDLTDFNQTQAAFTEIASQHKKIRALVNCAATWTGGKTVRELSSDEMNQSIMLNFFTAFNAIKAMLNLQAENLQKPSAIINVGATASLRGSKKCAAFAVAKGALRQLSQSLARELWPENIHVAHLVIDGLIGNQRTKALNPNAAETQFIDMRCLANNILQVIEQERSCWTFEWDVRPFDESW